MCCVTVNEAKDGARSVTYVNRSWRRGHRLHRRAHENLPRQAAESWVSFGAMTTPTDFLRLVLDPVRLAVLGAAAMEPVDVDALSDRLGERPRTIVAALASLRMAGLIDSDGRLDRSSLVEIAKAMPAGEPIDPEMLEGPWSAAEQEILSRFFRGSRLVEIPASASKRAVVMERLVQEFEPGVRYEERDVNRILTVFHPDYASLRRYLVNLGLLTRADGVYWRTGGRYETTEG